MEQPGKDAPIGERFAWLSRKGMELGFETLFDCILANILEDAKRCKDARRGTKQVTEANARMAHHSREVSRFVDIVGAINSSECLFQLSPSPRTALALFNMGLKEYLIAEISRLCSALERPAEQYMRKDISDFSFEKVIAIMEDAAPITWHVFSQLFCRSSKNREDDDLDDLMDLEVYEQMSLEDFIALMEKRKEKATMRNKSMVTAMGLSVCCFGLTRRANYVQGIIGYFLGSTTTGRRVMTVLNKLGVSISYNNNNTQCISIAASCRSEYRALAATRPWILTLDNLNFFAYMRQVVMNRTGYLENKIASYVLFPENPDGTIPEKLQKEDIDRSRALELDAIDLLVDAPTMRCIKKNNKVHIFRVLYKFCREEMDQHRQFLVRDERGATKIFMNPVPTIAPDKVLNHQKPSSLFTLPVLSLDETKVEELLTALTSLIDELGQGEKGYDFMIALVSGDWLTVRNIVLGLYQLQDLETSKDRLDFLEPVIGLFHLQMNVLKVEMQNFWEPMLEDYAGMFRDKKVSFKVPDFRAANFFYNDVLDGVVLAAVCQHPDVNVKNVEELRQLMGKTAKVKKEELRRATNAAKGKGKKNKKEKEEEPNESGGGPTGEQLPSGFDWEKIAEDIIEKLYNFEEFRAMRFGTDRADEGEDGADMEDRADPDHGQDGDELADIEKAPERMSEVRDRQRRNAQTDTDYETVDVEWPTKEGNMSAEEAAAREAEIDPNIRKKGERDLLYENNILFLREGLVYREYEDAIRSGDVGRIEKVIRYWAVMYQGTGLTNYPQEMIHLVACLLKVWGPSIRDMWLNSCLVNMSGKKGAWLPLDLFCEYVVRELKKRKNPTSNLQSGNYWQETLARQIMTMLASRQNLYTVTGSKSGQRTSKADSKPHAILVCQKLGEVRGLTRFLGGRYHHSGARKNHKIAQAVDHYGIGIKKIASGEPLKQYRAGTRCAWSFGGAFTSLEEDDEVVDLVDPLANGTGLGGGAFDDD